MEREILFRGKVSDEPDEWVQGYLRDADTIFQQTRHEKSKCCEYGMFSVKPKTIGQFTGITDKNGTKIFEGDIVELWCERSVYGRKQSVQDKYIKVRAVVEWGYQYSIGFMLNYNNEHNKKLCIAKNKEHYDRDIGKRCITDFLEKKKYIRHEIWKFLDDIEVIGSIHDNLELLEGL